MNTHSLKSLSIFFFTLILSSTANAGLVERLNGQAYYDDVLDITWLAEANLPKINHFGVSERINKYGAIERWSDANRWIAGMNSASYLGLNGWRLPEIKPINGSSFNLAPGDNGATDLGTGKIGIGWADANNNPVSELGYLFYATLIDTGVCSETLVCNTRSTAGPNILISDQFSNLTYGVYWTGTKIPDTQFTDDPIIDFVISGSGQEVPTRQGLSPSVDSSSGWYYVLPVHDGDIANVPAPATLLLVLTSLGLTGFTRKLRK